MRFSGVLFFLFATLYQCNAQRTDTALSVPPALFHPEKEPFVQGYIQRFGHGLTNLKKNNADLLAFVEYVLASNGIPKELKNLAVIESSLDNRTVSNMGAVGPWQFMPQTGRDFGLRINQTVDERYDIYKSTFAAAKMLKQLYTRYHDWDLVVAAYNCGTGHVDRAIAICGSRSFTDIQYHLPAESRNHVKKFIGTSFVIDKNVLSGAEIIHDKDTTQLDSAALASRGMAFEYIQAGFRLDKISDQLGIPLTDLANWNKNFQPFAAKNGYFWLILPFDKMADFLFYKNDILQASIQANIDKEKQTTQNP